MIAFVKKPLCWLIALGVLAGSLGLAQDAAAAPANIASELKTLDREVAQLNAELKKKKKHHHHKHHRHHKKKHTSAKTQSVSKVASHAKTQPVSKITSRAKTAEKKPEQHKKPFDHKRPHHHHEWHRR